MAWPSSDVPLSYDISRGVRNGLNFAVKTIPVLAGIVVLAIVILFSPSLRRSAYRDDPLLFASLGACLAAVLSLPASTQTGASENYFFTLAYFLSLALAAGIAFVHRLGIALPNFFLALSAAGWGALVAAIVLVFTGIQGQLSVRNQHIAYMADKECLDRMPKPLFVNDRYLSLPWMTPGNESYVLSDLYEEDRQLNRSFEGDGIGGRIAVRYFASLAIRGNKIPEQLDGASLDGYRQAPYSCPELVVLLRK